jgi:hypothetical protein
MVKKKKEKKRKEEREREREVGREAWGSASRRMLA